MNSEVIKYVAGGGKTTYSRGLLKDNTRGLYLTYNNAVKDEILGEGYLAMTLDSFLTGFIIPKAISKIPLIPDGVAISLNEATGHMGGSKNISIRDDGSLCNQSRLIGSVTLRSQYNDFVSMPNFPNKSFLSMIFQHDKLYISHNQRDELANFIIANHKDYIMEIIGQRFAYIIIDEAQDVKEPKEPFVEMLRTSSVPTIILGDENQNINGGSEWFGELKTTKSQIVSRRCGDGVCKWIRDTLNIDIEGGDKESSYNAIKYEHLQSLDDGNRVLLYSKANGSKIKAVLLAWNGPKRTIQNAKGATIEQDVVIIGDTMNKRFMYTAATRTTKSVYSTITRVNE